MALPGKVACFRLPHVLLGSCGAVNGWAGQGLSGSRAGVAAGVARVLTRGALTGIGESVCELRVCWAVSCSGCGDPLIICNVKRNHVNFLWGSTSPKVPEQQRASAQTLVTVTGPCVTALKTTRLCDIMKHLKAWGQTKTEQFHTRSMVRTRGRARSSPQIRENTNWQRTRGTCGGSSLPSRRATGTYGRRP